MTSAPSESGSGTEVNTGAYARQPLAPSAFNDAADGAISLTSTISFPEATAAYNGTVYGFGLFRDLTGGLPLWKGALTTPQVINIGDTFKVPAGSTGLTLTLD